MHICPLENRVFLAGFSAKMQKTGQSDFEWQNHILMQN
jgi:hypothetical protein